MSEFSPEQLAEIDKAIADPHGFICHRFIEAIITMDGNNHNSYIVDTLKTAKSRGLDLLIKLLQVQQQDKTGDKPTTQELMTAAATEPTEPLKIATGSE